MFIHDAIVEQLTCGDTQISAEDLQTTINNLMKSSGTAHRTGLQSQFQVSSFCGQNIQGFCCELYINFFRFWSTYLQSRAK